MDCVLVTVACPFVSLSKPRVPTATSSGKCTMEGKQQQQELVYNIITNNMAFPVVANEDEKYYSYECAFEIDAMVTKVETEDNEKYSQIVSEHVPVSVSIFSNVPEYDDKPIFIHLKKEMDHLT
jgi:hypothetical protein